MSDIFVVLVRYGTFFLLAGLALYFGLKGVGDIVEGVFYEDEE